MGMVITRRLLYRRSMLQTGLRYFPLLEDVSGYRVLTSSTHHHVCFNIVYFPHVLPPHRIDYMDFVTRCFLTEVGCSPFTKRL